ncbi:hypothetical protein [Paenibacillus sp. RC67]|uniref:hypothetical protein n=1 Tax=Paenibacillus sp. RC67 TaxID=3039392 RepID=UPI0024AC8845|nr:hypothetical protein [Paenibacillus sp. RC67]
MEPKELQFTTTEAQQYAECGQLEEWIHLYLNSAGRNPVMSQGLKQKQRYWVGPILVDVQRLRRCHGPETETDMEYKSPVELWEHRVNQFADMFSEGWDAPPPIVEVRGETLSVRDGNRRTAALQRAGIHKYWVIIWDNDNIDNIWRILNN